MTDELGPVDHARPEDAGKSKTLKDNLKSSSTWLRLVFMVVFLVLYGISRIVVGTLILLQFLFVLVTGQKNKRLDGLGQGLATYTYQIILYLTFNTEVRPFPFEMDWPHGAPRDNGL